MTDEQVKEVNARISEYLAMITNKKGNRYICPLCGSGTGGKKTPAGCIDPKTNRFSCFSCGMTSLNTIGLIQAYEKISIADAFKRADEIFGIPAGSKERCRAQPNEVETIRAEIENQRNTNEIIEDIDYTDYFSEAHSHINETDYPQRRGLTPPTINSFVIGYDSHWISPTALKRAGELGMKTPPASPRLIIPTGKGSYVARDTREILSPFQMQYSKIKEGRNQILNEFALLEPKEPIFVVEGEIDALSIIDVGGTAVSLGSTANYRMLLESVKKHRPKQPLVIYLDNDKAGRFATGKLIQGLHEIEIETLSFPVNVKFKDANEYLLSNREKFKMVIGKIEKYFEEVKDLLKKKGFNG